MKCGMCGYKGMMWTVAKDTAECWQCGEHIKIRGPRFVKKLRRVAGAMLFDYRMMKIKRKSRVITH